MLSSSGRAPHHFGLRLKVIRCAVRSTLEIRNGPADAGGPLRKPLLKASGVAVMTFGQSMPLPANMPLQAKQQLLKGYTLN